MYVHWIKNEAHRSTSTESRAIRASSRMRAHMRHRQCSCSHVVSTIDLKPRCARNTHTCTRTPTHVRTHTAPNTELRPLRSAPPTTAPAPRVPPAHHTHVHHARTYVHELHMNTHVSCYSWPADRERQRVRSHHRRPYRFEFCGATISIGQARHTHKQTHWHTRNTHIYTTPTYA